jgi:hypothetical protein
MMRWVRLLCVGSLISVTLVGCGRWFEERPAWRTEAEEACLSSRAVAVSSFISRAQEISGPGICGMEHPFRVLAFGEGQVQMNRSGTLACPMVASLEAWLRDRVQPAAETRLGSRVVGMDAGTYSCRPVNNQQGNRLSEHSFGNAIDIMSFTLEDGRKITVRQGWKGEQAEQDFLREVHYAACENFATVLGPGSDMFHYDHFHFDLARHSPDGKRRVCRPKPELPPQASTVPVAQRKSLDDLLITSGIGRHELGD